MHLYIGNKVYSSWSMRPWILMRAKDIAFHETTIPLRDTKTRATVIAVSPSGKVPCLIDGDVTVWDSLAIIEYLAEACPDKGIWPADRHARAHARCVSAEMHAGFQTLRSRWPMVVTQRFEARPLPTELQADVMRVCQIWRDARATFGTRSAGPFLYGDFSAADAMFAPLVSRFQTYSMALDPVSLAYAQAVRGHPAYAQWVAGATTEPWVLAQNEGETIIEDLRAKR